MEAREEGELSDDDLGTKSANVKPVVAQPKAKTVCNVFYFPHALAC
jgi:hypothetical protein